MVKLYNKATEEFLGRITDEQFQFLSEHLEEESRTDHDYYIRRETLDSFEQSGAHPNLVGLLRAAMKPKDAIEVCWEEEDSRRPSTTT
jgi:hypothetical protein